ncbi:S8 family serine peptidase [bacterium]|nr:S8 family serine peptidase [bacterium]MCI0603220.1 S8 family serine peptidase [bacterium]
MTTNLHNHSHLQNPFSVIPTSVRMNVDPELSGKGITIAFLDSGFHPHPDLTTPVDRIIAYHDVTQPDARLEDSPKEWDWHGTMTSVAAAGNGSLSDGVYRGLAHEAGVVLVKVSDRGKITEENIARGLDWVIKNKDICNIRVVSISLGGDEDVPYKDNIVDQKAEEAIRAGLIVVVAAGNSGCMDRHHTVPPANSPSVITVGGYDDNNQLGNANLHLYCSSYGPTADGLIKPEIIAPAMWVAAPILPYTDAYKKAQALTELIETYKNEPQAIRAEIESLLRDNKIISAHYQHVDGTSFAAPIVASVVSLILQANPELTPATVKNILISTAERIENAPVLRQGYGMLNARAAVEQAKREKHVYENNHFLSPRMEAKKLIFFYHHDAAEKVELAADFTNWTASNKFEKDPSGMWRAEVKSPGPGRYRYKFILNGNQWVDDPSNGLKEPDNHGGFNSVVEIS